MCKQTARLQQTARLVCIHQCGVAVDNLLVRSSAHAATANLVLQEVELIRMLIAQGQAHLFASWPAPGAFRSLHLGFAMQDADWTPHAAVVSETQQDMIKLQTEDTCSDRRVYAWCRVTAAVLGPVAATRQACVRFMGL
jgi:hypothetical protein